MVQQHSRLSCAGRHGGGCVGCALECMCQAGARHVMLLQNFHDSDSTPGGFVGGLEENYPTICADGWLCGTATHN